MLRILDTKEKIAVFGILLFCLSCVTNIEDSPLMEAFKVVHSVTIIALYVFSTTYYFMNAPKKLDFGHRIYILIGAWGLASAAWSDYPDQVLNNTAHHFGLLFVGLVICDGLGRDYRLFLWSTLFGVTAICALSTVVVMLWPDIGIVNDISYAALHSDFSLNGRWIGITDQPNQLGAYGAIGVLTAAYLGVTLQKDASFRKRLFVLGGCMAVTMVALIGSGSKTALLSSGIAFLAYIMMDRGLGWFRPEEQRFLPRYFNVAVLCVLAVFLFIRVFQIDTFVFEAMGRDGNMSGRVELWELGWEAITERPLSGWSFDTFATLRNTYGAFTYYQFHNFVIDFLAKAGIVGFALVVMIYADLISKFSRMDIPIDSIKYCVMFLIYFLVSGYSESSVFRPESYLWFTMVICWFYLIKSPESQEKAALLPTRGTSAPLAT